MAEKQIYANLNQKIAELQQIMEGGNKDVMVFPKENQHYLASTANKIVITLLPQ